MGPLIFKLIGALLFMHEWRASSHIMARFIYILSEATRELLSTSFLVNNVKKTNVNIQDPSFKNYSLIFFHVLADISIRELSPACDLTCNRCNYIILNFFAPF